MEKLLTSNELADSLGINPETVRRWTRENKIPFTQVGIQRMYSLSKVRKALPKKYQ